MTIVYYAVGGVVLFIMTAVGLAMNNMNRKHIRIGDVRKRKERRES